MARTRDGAGSARRYRSGCGSDPRPRVVPAAGSGTVLTVGEYDGVHRGHRTVISEMHKLAAEFDCRTAVVTFDVHPASIVRPESAPLLLTDLDQKIELLAETGVDYVLVVEFNEAQSVEPPEVFVDKVLVDCLRVRAIVVGADFHFGHQRRGNVELLKYMGARAQLRRRRPAPGAPDDRRRRGHLLHRHPPGPRRRRRREGPAPPRPPLRGPGRGDGRRPPGQDHRLPHRQLPT